MKKILAFFLLTLFATTPCFGATLVSLNKTQIIKAFVNKTATSIATDNLNGQTINNTFSMFLDDKGNIVGKMSIKPPNQPQVDKGTYTIENDGTVYLTWQHWDNAKKLCFHAYNTQNAYINVGCDMVFHTAFMKDAIRIGNQLTS